MSPLIAAIKKENIEIVEILLEFPNTDVNVQDRLFNLKLNGQDYDKISPLILAINVDNIKIFDLLLNHPNIDINMTIEPISDRSTIWTPLHMAIMLENTLFAEKLINHPNIDVNIIANFDESTSIFEVFEVHHFDLFYTPLQLTVELENIKMIELLLSHPKISLNEIEKYSTYMKLDSFGSCNFKQVEQTILHRSIQKNNINIIKLLLEQPKLDVNSFATFTFFPGKGFWGSTGVLIDSNKTIVKKTALHLAYKLGDQNIIQLFLNRKDIDINVQDEEGKKPNELSKDSIIDQIGLPFKLFSFRFALCIFVKSSQFIKTNEDSHLICLVKTKYDSGVTQWDFREQWNQFFKLCVHSLSETLTITVKRIENYKEDDVATTEINLSSFRFDRTTDEVCNLNPVNNNNVHGVVNLKYELCTMKSIESLENIEIFSRMNGFLF
ncbi:hypothetical protein M9Y10_042794 [Tritrichomonas musculus]|uniref:Ankyrin repeat protein n=1 Tax=Tritrichomonas musculus TaxID=1915356 RepID=A0ABR2JY72_9EUKA